MYQERLWPLLARRATAAAYRRSRRYRVAQAHACQLVDAQEVLPRPELTEHVAVYLADRLPGVCVVLLGVGGLKLTARLMVMPIRVVGRVVGWMLGVTGPAGGAN